MKGYMYMILIPFMMLLIGGINLIFARTASKTVVENNATVNSASINR